MFFSFDGLDGVGKTTQLELFTAWLCNQGRRVTTCIDPGSTALGEQIRRILLDRHDLKIARPAEMLLFMAARAQLVAEVIKPALAAGETVVSDRYLLANIVYQGHAGGMDVDDLWAIGRVATCGVMPDMTFVLDAPVELAWSRMGREPDRMERQGIEYQRRLRDGFRAEAAAQPDRIVVIDATRSVDEIQADIQRKAADLLRAG